MLTLPFPFLCLSKPVHLHPILYCGYGYSAVGSIALRKQCFGSKLQTLKNEQRCQLHNTEMCVLCLCFSLFHLCLQGTYSLQKEQGGHRNPNKAYVF